MDHFYPVPVPWSGNYRELERIALEGKSSSGEQIQAGAQPAAGSVQRWRYAGQGTAPTK